MVRSFIVTLTKRCFSDSEKSSLSLAKSTQLNLIITSANDRSVALSAPFNKFYNS